MSRNNQKPSIDLNSNLVPRQFSVRLWDTWDEPSLILMLDGREQRELRETFDIHWKDLDIRYRLVDEVCGTGVARDQAPRRDKGVKIIYELNRVDGGIQVLIYVMAMTGVANPKLDDNGYPRKLTYDRVLPESHIREFFDKAAAFVKAMETVRLTLWALETENQRVFREIGGTLELLRDDLKSSEKTGLTVTVEEAVRKDEGRKDKEPKKAKKAAKSAAPAPAADPTVSADDDLARTLTIGLGLPDPGVGMSDAAMPAPVATASPAPAPKPKKEKPKAIKLGSPEAAQKLAELGASPNGTGTNGQS